MKKHRKGEELGACDGAVPDRATGKDFPGYETDRRIGGVWGNMGRAGDSSRQKTDSVKTAKGICRPEEPGVPRQDKERGQLRDLVAGGL